MEETRKYTTHSKRTKKGFVFTQTFEQRFTNRGGQGVNRLQPNQFRQHPYDRNNYSGQQYSVNTGYLYMQQTAQFSNGFSYYSPPPYYAQCPSYYAQCPSYYAQCPPYCGPPHYVQATIFVPAPYQAAPPTHVNF